eukprot:CAMPEP_0183747778 /NCGR_PEP_ID=MMETSP0737-20130205/67437_1 /TAXON_ID=385413 /ORGANISM="Thalassiosira miniscula, Strain CCMP1093" /LENGTH=405 /DNA_ID=CAMNT_0025983495 /DNA_START=220 /DNA_END=1438 /DNA_ORIENTATION=-
MQTRASRAAAAAAVASGTTRASAAATAPASAASAVTAAVITPITPSPPRKKAKTQRRRPKNTTIHNTNNAITSKEESQNPKKKTEKCNDPTINAFDSKESTNNIRDEMQKLVLSHANVANDDNENDTSNRSLRGSSTAINTNTIGGWCLVDGLVHCAMASNGILLPLMKEHGPPAFYLDHINTTNKRSQEDSSNTNTNDGFTSFRSLCRIVAGQQLAGPTAKTIWRRLLRVADATEDDPTNLTPDRILSLVANGDVEKELRAPAGLSNAKCNCIIGIATSFREGILSDRLLLGGNEQEENDDDDGVKSSPNGDDEVRSRLLGIKGLGPWSVDMFLLFQCHRSDILPVGDLAFRNGTSNLWKVKGRAKGGGFCQKKDEHVIKELHEPFAPYRSISSYYMYKCSGMK